MKKPRKGMKNHGLSKNVLTLFGYVYMWKEEITLVQ